MKLIGGQEILTADCGIKAIIRFYGDLFGRLPREVKHTGSLTRFIAYQSPVNESDWLHFFGIEVERIESIPTGLIAWELSENERMILECRDGLDTITSREKIEWLWRDRSNGRTVGEFSIESKQYWMSMNSYVKPQEIGNGCDDVLLVDYDPSWQEQFDEMAAWLRDQLGTELVLRVEHYGSTSVPDMPAKPVIDILVEVPSFAQAKCSMIPLLNREEWEYCWYSNHMMFIKRDRIMGQRTHHVHVATHGHDIWNGLAFRDYLRSHEDEASNYEALKRDLATLHRESRELYTDAKSEYVQRVTAKALRSI